MRVEDLKQSVSIMSKEELQEHVLEIRRNRRIPLRDKKVKKEKKPFDLDNLTVEQAQQLLEELTG